MPLGREEKSLAQSDQVEGPTVGEVPQVPARKALVGALTREMDTKHACAHTQSQKDSMAQKMCVTSWFTLLI